MVKRLIVCLDGTWNAADRGDNVTNVVKIMDLISASDDHRVPQVTFYDRGVGTGGPVDKIVGGGFGKGLGQNVRDGYRFLAQNYEPGDEIYAFGFSRGAYTARSLCGLIRLVGLLRPQALGRLSKTWELYQQEPTKRNDVALAQFQNQAHQDVRIKGLGVWDTVGALGIPGETLQWVNQDKYQFHDTRLGDNVENAFHAIAIDEKRGPFAPTLWQRPKGERKDQTVEQVWFPGVHSDVGGSYREAGLSDLSLAWMIERIRATTPLVFVDDYRERIKGDPMGKLHESRSLPLYAVSRLYPYQRLISQLPVKGSFMRRWIARSNRPDPGHEFVNEHLHWSAVERFERDAGYRPANLEAAITDDVPVVARRTEDILPLSA